MKKIFVTLVMLVLMICCFAAMDAFADNTIDAYSIPKATKAPSIDGQLSEGEWDGALRVWAGPDSFNWVVNDYAADDDGNPAIQEGSAFYIMWDNEAIYFAVRIIDKYYPSKQPASTDPLNTGEGIQLAFYAPTCTDSGNGDGNNVMFYDFSPFTSDNADTCAAYEHFHFQRNVSELFTMASEYDANEYTGYTMEWKMTWDIFQQCHDHGFGGEYTPHKGTEMKLALVILDMDQDDGQYYGYCSAEWCNTNDGTDIFTLTDITTDQNAKTQELNSHNSYVDGLPGDVPEEGGETTGDGDGSPKIEKDYIYDYWVEDDVKSALTSPNQTGISYTEDGVKFTYVPGEPVDPYVTFNPINYAKGVVVEKIDPKKVSFIVLKVKAEGTNGEFELFYCGTAASVQETYTADGNWQYILFDFTDDDMWLEQKKIKTMRFDWATGIENAENASLTLGAIAFFGSESEAYAYMGKEVPTTDTKADNTKNEKPTTAATTVADEGKSENTTADNNTDEKGCGSVVSGSVALVATVALCGVMLKKKKEN